MDQSLIDALLEQMAREDAASRHYRNLWFWSIRSPYHGASQFFKSAYEGKDHDARHIAKLLLRYEDVPVIVPAVPEANASPDSLLDAFSSPEYGALSLELEDLDSIKALYRTSEESDACEVSEFLDDYLSSQVKTVKQLRAIVVSLKQAGTDGAAIRLADKQIGSYARKNKP